MTIKPPRIVVAEPKTTPPAPPAPTPAKAEDAEAIRHRRAKIACLV